MRAVACISHHPSTAVPPRRASTALRLARVLNVVSATPPRSDRRAPCSHAPWRSLATMRGEKCRLAPPSGEGEKDGDHDGGHRDADPKLNQYDAQMLAMHRVLGQDVVFKEMPAPQQAVDPYGGID